MMDYAEDSRAVGHVAPRGGITNAVSDLHGSISELDEQLDRLFAVLDPILGQESPNAIALENKDADLSSQLQGQISEASTRLRHLTRRVRERTARIDL